MDRPGRHEVRPPGAFGKLVCAFRKQRGWTQQELAERWGFSREYVSLVELGKRRLYGEEQVLRLAEILDIPLERLAAIGRYVPRPSPMPAEDREAEDALLQALLEPARTTVKLSWLVWYANSDPSVVRDLMGIVARLESAVGGRRGKLRAAALEMLAYAHEMLGKVAFDKLDYPDALTHFREMHDLGAELGDPDIVALALIHRADLVRRQGRYDVALKWLAAADPAARRGRLQTAGTRWQTLARAHTDFGNRPAFLEAIMKAHEHVAALPPAAEGSNNDFTALEVLQEQAHGHALLGEPEKALEIYVESERRVAFRPIRDQGNFAILRAQAYAHGGYVDEGVELAIEGLRLTGQYDSRRHATRVRRMYDRLSGTPVGKHPRMADLRGALEARGI
ncbi:MAG TPA: helix-turn-helix transcriptional regulator [Actinomycetota bacterium]